MCFPRSAPDGVRQLVQAWSHSKPSIQNVYCFPNMFDGGGGTAFDFIGGAGDSVGLSANEKATIQHLNDYVDSYLDKVRTLDAADAELEKKIREKKTSPSAKNYSQYFNTIIELSRQIQVATKINAGIDLSINLTKLAADDYWVE